jgi:gliding motility-associated-like protein
MKISKVILTFFLFISLGSFAQNTVGVPNIFTPNGDGQNDVFSIRAVGYDNLSCTIINRYGEIIYRYFGINGTWDGYTHAGVKVTAGTYFVVVELTAENGEVGAYQGTVQVQY